MEGEEQIKQPKELLNNARKGRIKVFLVCLLISAFIWFTRALSEDYQEQQSIPIKVTGLRSDFSLGNEIPSYIQLSLESHGFGMIGEALSAKKDTLELDLGFVGAPGQYSMGIQKIRQAATSLLGQDVEITQIEPESFQLIVVKRATRRVAVEPLINVEVDDNHFLKRAYTMPDSIEIQGSESVINVINAIQTEPINLGNVSDSDTLDAELTSPPGITLGQTSVKVVIPVDEYTEKTLRLKINAPDLNDGFRIRTYPDSIDVTFLCGLKDYEKVQAGMFEASIDPGDRSKLESAYKLPVILLRQPDGISQIRMNPARVEFVLLEQ